MICYNFVNIHTILSFPGVVDGIFRMETIVMSQFMASKCPRVILNFTRITVDILPLSRKGGKGLNADGE